ncbi:hypothetical protein LAZ67_10000736 [Cordylochernes scorpioides]|uniref:Uncharacterized protein n=1 Tax=Cordylochernes scorpioides TaxID=51811 RepID=A0ABY6KVX2_9ARAC|nr:hypothetical protein LAZ67_10000736 [Cordylochernes scorpioides]
MLGIWYDSCPNIIGEHLNMKKLCAYFVSRNLTDQQRETRLSICKDLIETSNIDSGILKTIKTGDKTWCFFYPQTKKQSLEWHTPSSLRKKKVRLDKSKGKLMLVVFFEYQGLVYYEFIEEGVTINNQAYKVILVGLCDEIRKKETNYLNQNIGNCYMMIPMLIEPLLRFSSSSEVIENATVELNKLKKIHFDIAFQQLFSTMKHIFIRELLQNGNFEDRLNELEAAPWNYYKMFLRTSG